MHIYTAWDLICCPVTHVPCADCLCCAKYALALPIHSGGLSVHLCGMPVCTSTACTLCIVILLPHLCILQSNVVALLWLLHRHSKAICGGQAGICILGLLLNGCCRRAYTRRKFELSNSSCVCNAPSCATLWHVPIRTNSSFGFVQSEQTHLLGLLHVAPATKQCAAVSSNVAVLFAIPTAACHTEQTPLQMCQRKTW